MSREKVKLFSLGMIMKSTVSVERLEKSVDFTDHGP